MESIIFIVLPISVVVVVAIVIAAFFEVAFAGPRHKRQDLPLLSGDALRRWASGKARQVVADFALRPRTGGTAVALAHEIEALTSRIIEDAVPRVGRRGSAECERNHNDRIHVTTPETLAIVNALRSRLSRRELKQLRTRAEKSAERMAAIEQPSKSLVPNRCPLLSPDGCCISYESRPVYCRGLCSNCIGDGGERPLTSDQPDQAFAAAVAHGVSDGLSAGLKEAGLDGQSYELNSALAVALDAPNAAVRWAGGEAVLRPRATIHGVASN